MIDSVVLTRDIRLEILFKEITNVEIEIQQDLVDLRECTGPLKIVQTQHTEIKERLQILKNKIKLLKQLILEQDVEKTKKDLLKKVERHKDEWKSLNNDLRKAHILCKLNMEKASQEERLHLLEGGENALHARKLKTKQDMLNTAYKLTEDLHRVRNRMQSEVERSGEVLTELEKSSKQIGQVTGEHRLLEVSIRSGKNILTKLKRRDWTDRLLILFGLLFFLLVVFYVVKMRLGITFFGWFTEYRGQQTSSNHEL